jgi:hypothetical protein
MPVIITYYTAWVDETGQVNFRDDVYSNDKKIAQMMFTNTPLIVIPASGDSLASRKAGSANKDTARKRR